ncbi:MAG: PAS domain S-box protein [Deltaproteobacteria bacterium]|nr:PAS domain S-box protein [Deltaproteobacteria bacterium]
MKRNIMQSYIKEIVEKLVSISKFLTSIGEVDADEERKRLITLFFLLFGIPVLFAYAAIHLINAEYSEGTLDLAVGVTLGGSLVYLRYLKQGLIIYRINIAAIGCLFLYLIFIGGAHGSRMLWMYTLPLIALFLLGKKEGLLWTLAIFFLSLIILFDPYFTVGTFQYEYDVKTRFLVSFMLVTALTYIYESVRQSFQEAMERERIELREERDRLSHITNNIHDIVWSLDLATMQFVYVSPSVEHLTGFSVEEAVKNPIEEILTPESYEDSMKILEEELAQEDDGLVDRNRMREAVWEFYHKNGRILVFEVKMSFLRDENDKPTGVIGVSRDITDRRKTEKDLLESEERYSLHFSQTSEVIYSLDSNLRALAISPSVESLLGYTPDELIGRDFTTLNLLTPESLEKAAKDTMRVLAGEKIEHQVYEFITKDGTRKFGEVSGVPLFRDGKVVAVVSVARDVTERKAIEEKLKKNEEMFRLIVENMYDMLRFTDTEGNVVYASPSHKTVLGFSPEERVGRSTFEVVHPDDIEKIQKAFADAFATSSPGRAEYRIQHADGHYLWVETIGNFLYDSDGKISGTVMSTRDITDRKRAEEEARSYYGHLTLINKILRHDLTNDLTVIRSALSLYEDTKNDELLKDASGHVEKSVELIRRMRELEAFISQHRELKVYNMREVIEKVKERYHSIDFEIEGDCRIMADESLHSVIDNLLRNAVIHGKTDRISVSISEAGNTCDVRIADYGVGIPDYIKSQIFDEGFTFGDSGQTGIGLHIVKKAMDTYGGQVYVEDNKPQGTVFILRLRAISEEDIR